MRGAPRALLAAYLLAAVACAAPCDRAASRDVRAVVQQVLLQGMPSPNSSTAAPLLDPATCPLAADRYARQEAAKEPLGGGRWRCRECGKAFLAERHLDAHLANRHSMLEPALAANASGCLGDWHGALHATQLASYLSGRGGWAADPLPCRPAAASRLQAACLELSDACFLPSQQAASDAAAELRHMHALLAKHLCAAHTCDKRRKRSHLLALAQAHRRRQGSWGGPVAAAGAVALAAFWLLLWLVASDGGNDSRTFRRLASARRRLAAAADDGPVGLLLGCLPTAMVVGGKVHGE